MKESNAPVIGRTPFQKWLDKYQGILYLIPWIIGFVVFKAFPFGQSLYYSFTDMNFFKSGTTFVGLQNYITAFTTTTITKIRISFFLLFFCFGSSGAAATAGISSSSASAGARSNLFSVLSLFITCSFRSCSRVLLCHYMSCPTSNTRENPLRFLKYYKSPALSDQASRR